MKSFLEEIYNFEAEGDEELMSDKDYNNAVKNSSEAFEGLNKVLSEKQKELLNSIWEANCAAEYAACLVWFKKGFKAGLLAAVESLLN